MGKKVKTLEDVLSPRLPEDDDRYVGIEIEFLSDCGESYIAYTILRSDIADYVSLTRDGSVSTDDEDVWGHELRVLAKQSELQGVMRKVGKLLRNVGARVNDSCGLHVHIDMRPRDPDESYRRLRNVQPLLFAMCPPERLVNSYCEPNQTQTLREELLDEERYRAINAVSLDKHQTLEVRLHHGTVDTRHIALWAGLLCRIVDRGATLQRPIRTSRTLDKHVKLPKTVRQYVNSELRARRCA